MTITIDETTEAGKRAAAFLRIAARRFDLGHKPQHAIDRAEAHYIAVVIVKALPRGERLQQPKKSEAA